MALLNRKNALKSALAGVAAVGLVSTSAALAEDRAPTTPASVEISDARAEELRLLRAAEDSSTAHAKAGFNIGLVLHVGDDFQPEEIPHLREYFRDRYQRGLDAKYPDQGGAAAVFLAPNPGSPSTLLSASIGDQLFHVDNEKYGLPADLDTALLDLETADLAVEDVLEVLPVAKALQLKNERNGYTTSASLLSTPVPQ